MGPGNSCKRNNNGEYCLAIFTIFYYFGIRLNSLFLTCNFDVNKIRIIHLNTERVVWGYGERTDWVKVVLRTVSRACDAFALTCVRHGGDSIHNKTTFECIKRAHHVEIRHCVKHIFTNLHTNLLLDVKKREFNRY